MKINIFKAFSAIAVSAVMISGVSCASVDPEMMALQVSTYTIERQDIQNYISVSGTVEGSNIVKITSDINTKVKSLNVEVGTSVKEGDILCTFDSTDLQSEYDNLKESYDKTNNRLEKTHAINQRNLENAQKEKENTLYEAQKAIDKAVNAQTKAYDKYNSLATKETDYWNKKEEYYVKMNDPENSDISASQKYAEYEQLYTSTKAERESLGEQLSSYDDAVRDANDAYETAERNANNAVQSAQDVIDNEKFDTDTATQTQLEKLQEKINKCTVKAPKDGIITALNVSEGSIPTSEAIMTIEDTSVLRIKVQINEADILNVHEGQKAIITTTATGEKEFSGTVGRVVNIMSGQTSNMITGQSTGGGYSAEISIDAQEEGLLIGMSAKAKIILDEKSDVLAVPYDAISENEDGTYSVYIAQKQGEGYVAKAVDVTKGMETNYLTEITSSELSEGDVIITEADYVSDGNPVNISESYYGE